MSLIWKLTNVLFTLSKCQKSLQERSQLVKISPSIRSLLDFWKDSSHKKSPISQNMVTTLINSIQEITSKVGIARGGILSELRTGLLQCLPVLENHSSYLTSMATRKQIQRSTNISSAVECVVRDISDREKVKLIEIGEREVTAGEVKKIVQAFSEKDFYEPVNLSVFLPENRKRRFKVLHQFLPQQSPFKLCLWIFDNHGVAPQSVFGFLVNLEDSPNIVMKYVMDLRPQLLAEQKIFDPREFLRQMKFYCSDIVNLTSSPVRILMDMMLGNDRSSDNAPAKLVEERALDAILSDDDELALDMRTFNGRESQYLTFLAVVRRTLSEYLAEDKNRWQTAYDGTVVSNFSMAFSLPDLFKQCIENALKEDPDMPIPSSDKYLTRYLYPRTAAAAAATSTSESLLPLRWAVQQKLFDKPNPDSYYNMSQYKSLKTMAVTLGNDLVVMIATDDKSGIDVGEPDLPIVACQHPGKSWIPSQLKLGEGQHSFHKFNLTPSVRLIHDLPSDKDGSFYRGKPQLTLKDAVFEPSSGARHFAELKKSFELNPEDRKPITIITNDGGPDHNIHHDRNKAALLAFFLNSPHILYLSNFQMAANRSSFHPVEKLNCILNLALNGVALARDKLEDPIFEKLLNGCKTMVDIREKAAHNPGLVGNVENSLKSSKERIEQRTRRASLKENTFEVFESANKEEIKDFMKVLKNVDNSFEVSDYLDTKKTFHLTGPLLDYYNQVSTESYYCITIEKHRNMSAEFLNSLYENLHIPIDLHPIPCPIRDLENPEKYLRFDEIYHSSNLRSYDDKERPGKLEKKSHNIPFVKSLVRASYCRDINIICVGCGKRRVVYSQYKPSLSKIEQARHLFEDMRYECGSRLCTFGTEGVATILETKAAEPDIDDEERNASEGAYKVSDTDNLRSEIDLLGQQSIFSVFFVDESLTCASPMEKHLYEIIPPSVTISSPCYYCGETDLVRISENGDQAYPLCLHCMTVRKLGPVQKRKKRTIVPRDRKSKNKKKKGDRTAPLEFGEFLQDLSDDGLDDEENCEFGEMEKDDTKDDESSDDSLDWEIGQVQKKKKSRTIAQRKRKEKDPTEIEDSAQDINEAAGESKSSDEYMSSPGIPSLPPSPTIYPPVAVEDLLEGSD